MMQRVGWIVGFCLAACASSQPAGPAGAESELASVSTSEPAAPAASAASTDAPTPSATPGSSATEPSLPEPAAPKASGASIHDVCFAMCDKVKEKCPKSAFESCRVNCGKYESPSEGCEGVVKAALSCARDAADLVCANVAPESCAKQFRQISACASGQKPVEAADTGGAKLPSGFALYDNATLGVQAPMPEGTAAGTEPNVVVQAKGSDGAMYSIRKLPRPEGKLNEKAFLKLAMNLFGRCSDKMKMQGMVDKPGRTSINYTMKCPDGAEEMGLFWATEKALFIASVRGGASKLGAEAFLYGFEAK